MLQQIDISRAAKIFMDIALIVALCVAVLFNPKSAYAEEQGDTVYVSLDTQIVHGFKTSGDYEGAFIDGKGGRNVVSGVYEQGKNICWLPNEDGSISNSGNLILHYGDHECCLQFRTISDKISISFVWDKPWGIPNGVCRSQVFVKK